MYLSKLRIFGFKSFANRVEVNYPGEGITSVVGPNGCGKSNIIDAIRWVLGEQRARALRSSKMEDVIFSGTADRPAMNMAEVSLLIKREQQNLQIEVRDNGVGLNHVSGHMGSGVGLSNLKQRVEALFAGQGEISISESAQGGVCVRLTWPMES